MPHPDWILRATEHRTDWTLDELYDLVCETPSDINEHCPTLREYARRAEAVTELGMRHGVSTIALLAGVAEHPDAWLTSYDLGPSPMATLLTQLDQRFSFIEGDSLSVSIRPTELLFIDTLHTYRQLRAELDRHADKVSRWIILHDTTTYGERGEGGGRGLNAAVDELVARGQWEIAERRENCNGLTVLERSATACQ